MQSKYKGYCIICDSQINIGDEISQHKYKNQIGLKWVHAKCNTGSNLIKKAKFEVVYTENDVSRVKRFCNKKDALRHFDFIERQQKEFEEGISYAETEYKNISLNTI